MRTRPVKAKGAARPEGPILVIKHGALGDFVLAIAPFQAIRAHHPAARIVLLTTSPYADLARQSGCFDEIWIDDRPPLWRLGALFALSRRLRRAGFARVYDLQTSGRSGRYFQFFGRRPPEWSGIARGASHRHANPERDRLHTVERQKEQLAAAGVRVEAPPDLAFLDADLARFALPADFVLLVPGGSAHRVAKRWPVENFAELARRLLTAGQKPVAIGAAAEAALGQRLVELAPGTIDLTGQTGFPDLAALARGARAAVGNDTGPMHLIAAAGCRTLVLFSAASDPALAAPRGARVRVLQRSDLAALGAGEVAALLEDPGW